LKKVLTSKKKCETIAAHQTECMGNRKQQGLSPCPATEWQKQKRKKKGGKIFVVAA